MKEVFIELLDGRFSVKASQITAFMILEDEPRKIKVEYSVSSSLTVGYPSERDAKEVYENLKKYMNNLKQ